MNIEDKIFNRYSLNLDKLKKFGFKQNGDFFVIEKPFKENQFKAVITVNSSGKVQGTIYDIENNDEFLPFRVEGSQGAFVGEVKSAYEKILKNIRKTCFERKYFIFPQSNRITNFIIEKYGNQPEFLWDKFKGSGIFRNPETKKWYFGILDADRSKLQKNKKGFVELALLKLYPDEAEEITKKEHFYKGYHMNKKYWISVILDDTVPDEKIIELIEKSHTLTGKKQK